VTPRGSAGLSLRDGLDLSGLTHLELWLRYVGIGGTAPSSELAEQIMQGGAADTGLDAYEHNLIAQALNEHFLDLGQDHPVGYLDAAEDSLA
jgi:hypothetical protein